MDTLDELHRHYRASLPDKQAQLQAARAAVQTVDAGLAQAKQLHLLLHRLCGSAGTYGHDELAGCAWVLAREWADWLHSHEAQRRLPAELCARQSPAWEALWQALARSAE